MPFDSAMTPQETKADRESVKGLEKLMGGPLLHDKLGQTIVEGDYIAYGHALGRCAGIRIGKIIGFDYKNPKNPKIIVRGVQDDYSWECPTLCKKPGWLEHTDRILLLRRDQVPETYKKLLEKA